MPLLLITTKPNLIALTCLFVTCTSAALTYFKFVIISVAAAVFLREEFYWLVSEVEENCVLLLGF